MNSKQIIPIIAALVIFYIATAFFFQAEVFQNKSLPQSDVIQFEGMSHWPIEYRNNEKEEALWNEGMFAGMPDFMVSTGNASPIPNTLHTIFSNLLPIAHSGNLLLLSLICFYILLLAFDVNPILAIFGALVYAFNTYNIINIEVGHVTKMWTIAYSSLVIAGLRYSFKGKMWWGIPLTALGLTLNLRGSHIQITYYLVFVCSIYLISEIVWYVRKRELVKLTKIGTFLLLVAIISGGTVACTLWVSKEYSKYSIRGERLLTPEAGTESKNLKEGLDKDYAFSWSQGVEESFTLLVPFYKGGSSGEKLYKGSNVYEFFERAFGKQQTKRFLKTNGIRVPMYFGDQPFTAGPLYAGAITCFLFVLALFVVDARHKYWMLTAATLALLFAWGDNFKALNYFLFDHFPLFNKFRSVSMALSMTLILMPLLGFIGLDKILKTKFSENTQRKLFIATGIVGGFCLLLIFSSFGADYSVAKDQNTAQQLFKDNKQLIAQFITALEADRGSFLRSDAFRSLALILIVAGLIWATLKEKISLTIAMVAIGILSFGELWVVGKRYLYDAKFEKQAIKQAHQQKPADTFILKDKDPHYRVYNLRGGFQEAYTSYFHRSIGGYHAAKMRRYQDLIEKRLSAEQQQLIGMLQTQKLDFSSLHAFNMLNTKYFKFGDTEREVIRNNTALGNAWWVHKIIDVKNADEEMVKLGEINTANTAVINLTEFNLSPSSYEKDSIAKVQLVASAPREMVYESNSKTDGIIVFSEIYYPEGWIATIDGIETPILRANYALRALEVPAGKHKLVFSFKPTSYLIGYQITTISGYLFGLLILVGFGFAFYRSLEESKKIKLAKDNQLEGKTVASMMKDKHMSTNTKKQEITRQTANKKNSGKKRK